VTAHWGRAGRCPRLGGSSLRDNERGTDLGRGAGTARRSGSELERHGPQAARDIADGVFKNFAAASLDRLGADGVRSIRSLLEHHDTWLTPAGSPPWSCRGSRRSRTDPGR
jgi:hypothetical protein